MTNNKLPIRIFHSNKDMLSTVHPHWHDEIEILYFVSGTATQQINNSIFEVKKGDLVIINSDSVHSTHSVREEECEILVIMMDINIICNNPQLPQINRLTKMFNERLKFPNPIKTDSEIGKQLLESVLKVEKSVHENRDGFEAITISSIYGLIGLSIQNFELDENKSKHTLNQKEKDVLNSTFELIDRNYQNDITLKRAAEASNFSTSHFIRLFKQSTGMTFKNYLCLNRINRAEKLLQTNKPIGQIAYECGFNSQTSFIRAFKKYKLTTPSSYRNNIKSKLEE